MMAEATSAVVGFLMGWSCRNAVKLYNQDLDIADIARQMREHFAAHYRPPLQPDEEYEANKGVDP